MDKIYVITRRSYMSSSQIIEATSTSLFSAEKFRDSLKNKYDYTQIIEVHGPYDIV